ncbi:flavin reductase family protein [Nocardioides sp. Root151]|uniref:flavin reductase family protein n=1 Tax=Nocardioides sp. Root151 TaxID=1736475 RepID=UPI0009EBAF9A|nr:flavin reductase family protein [Nocardioides sp. Root151]
MSTDVRPTDTTPTSGDMRAAMGIFASGVTIVTGIDSDGPVGFACQSFASVSLEPPLILFCADHGGRSWPRIQKTGRFCVNVLGEAQSELCARFGSSRGTRFEGLDWELSRWSAPSLPGVMLRVHCEVEDVHVAGDHDVVIGRVRELEYDGYERPMIFYRGAFGTDFDERAQSHHDATPASMLTWGDGIRWG